MCMNELSEGKWIREFGAAITVCDENGKIIEMNERSQKTFEKDGGAKLIGKSLFDCHPERAKVKLKQLLDEKKPNAYTIEKGGKKKLIYQSPWFEGGTFKGFVELSIELPEDMPHFVRKA